MLNDVLITMVHSMPFIINGVTLFHQLVQSFTRDRYHGQKIVNSIQCEKNESCLLLYGTPRKFAYSSYEAA